MLIILSGIGSRLDRRESEIRGEEMEGTKMRVEEVAGSG